MSEQQFGGQVAYRGKFCPGCQGAVGGELGDAQPHLLVGRDRRARVDRDVHQSSLGGVLPAAMMARRIGTRASRTATTRKKSTRE